MKNKFKNVLLKALLKLRISGIIEELAIIENSKKCKSQVRCNNVIFNRTANVCNLQSDPEKITVGDDTIIDGTLLVLAYGGEIKIGEKCYVGEDSRIWSGEKVTIGNNVLIAHNVNIIDTNSHEFNYLKRAESYRKIRAEGLQKEKSSIITAPIIIEDYAWISFGVSVLKGVTIGKGAIIGAGSVVTKNVPPFSLAAGIPSKVIRMLDKKDNPLQNSLA